MAYIAFPCPVCEEGDVVNWVGGHIHRCQNRECKYECDDDTFWALYKAYTGWHHAKNDALFKFLRAQPEWHFDRIKHSHSMAVTWKLRGFEENSKKCEESAKKSMMELLEEHQVCYCGWWELEDKERYWEELFKKNSG